MGAAQGPRPMIGLAANDLHFARAVGLLGNFERKFKDQDGIVFDISEKGWLGTTR